MDYEREIIDLKKRITELEKCCEDFRSCKSKIGERIDRLEQKL